ncbi:MAG: hypothetical protein VW929_09830 [Actinomycetota bacterium]
MNSRLHLRGDIRAVTSARQERDERWTLVTAVNVAFRLTCGAVVP